MKGGFFMPDNTLKYTRSEKLKIIKEHIDEGFSYTELSEKYGLAKSTIKYQVRLYLAHGEKAFKEEPRRVYTREEKLIAIKRHNDGEAYGAIAVDMCLSDPSIVKDWCQKFLKEGEAGIADTFSRKAYMHHDDKILEKEYKKLLEDLERTKAENEYLKKSFPQILKRSKQSSKK